LEILGNSIYVKTSTILGQYKNVPQFIYSIDL